jgi:hypothetical protein
MSNKVFIVYAHWFESEFERDDENDFSDFYECKTIENALEKIRWCYEQKATSISLSLN